MTHQPIPSGPFGCILADPPWRFVTYNEQSAVPTQASDPYETMTLAEMVTLPVPEVAAADCALIMWVSGTHMPVALALGSAWGFRFIRSELFVWVKDRPFVQPKQGMGYWTRNGAECAMLFVRGSPKVLSHDVDQVLYCSRGEHSAKPEQLYDRIERLVGGPYLELFARRRRVGWQSWGNQIAEELFDEPSHV